MTSLRNMCNREGAISLTHKEPLKTNKKNTNTQVEKLAKNLHK